MAFGGMGGGGGGMMSEINTTPLVDVMLVLLVVFILIAPVVTHRIKVKLPILTVESNDAPPKTVNLTIDADGNLFWNDVAISDDELAIKLHKMGQENADAELHLRADKAVKYKRISEVMGTAQSNGVIKLGFLTQPVHE